MKKQRQSNFELLRILLMIAIPLYHLMLYGGMNNLPYNSLTISSLIICSGGAIVADYAFMALSAYFLLDGKGRPVISRFLSVLAQVIVIYIIKMVILRKGLNITGENFLYEAFLVEGSWWFIYVYLIVLLIYPFLNRIIYTVQTSHLSLICMLLGVCFIYNGITYNANFLSDFISFLFTYFVIGYLRQTDFQTYFGMKNRKSVMISIYVVGYIITFFTCLIVKWPGVMENNEIASEVVRHMVGRYSFIQFAMGIAVFLLFKAISIKPNKWINSLAKNTFFVFLLHETVMAIFWHFDKLKIVEDKVPYDSVLSLVLWCFIYIICAFGFAIIIRLLYELIFKKVVERSIEFICNHVWVKKIEEKYLKLVQIEQEI